MKNKFNIGDTVYSAEIQSNKITIVSHTILSIGICDYGTGPKPEDALQNLIKMCQIIITKHKGKNNEA